MKTKKKNLLKPVFFALTALAVLSFVSYFPIFKGFFQQDEWLAFGFHFLIQEEGLNSLLKNAFILRLGHYSPFNLILEQTLFNVIGLNYFGWAVSSILMHFLNAVLVFMFAKQIFKNTMKGFAASVLFIVTASAFQATAWPVADIGTHMSVFFALICLILFFDFIDQGRKFGLALSMIALVVSILFKETAIALFGILPLAYILFSQGKRQTGKMEVSVIILVTGLLFFSIRLFALAIPPEAFRGTIYEQAPSVSTQFDAGRFVYNIATFPIKGVSQSIVPSGVLLNMANKISGFLPGSLVGQNNTTDYDIFVQKYSLEVVNLTVFIVILSLALKVKKEGIFFLIFIMANSVVYALSPERVGRITIIDSRNLYFVSIGAAILIVQISQNLFKSSNLKIFTLVGLVAVLNFLYLNSSLGSFVIDGQLRSGILTRISSEYKHLPDKVIFYTESDSSFYGLPETVKIMPFQSGFGQTLIIWYYPKERFPDDFLKRKYLWEITDQGYMEADGRGFGYFRDLNKLKETLAEFNLNPDSVISYRYNSKMNGLTDITSEIREKLVK